MQRYFFHTADGFEHRDETGTELTDLDAARTEAVRLLGSLLNDNPAGLWKDHQVTVTVQLESGLILFTITTFVSEAAAGAHPRNLSNQHGSGR